MRLPPHHHGLPAIKAGRGVIENEGKPKTNEISQTRLGSLNLSPEVSTTLSTGTKSSGEQRCKKTSLLLETSLNGLILNITIPLGIFIKAFMSKVNTNPKDIEIRNSNQNVGNIIT